MTKIFIIRIETTHHEENEPEKWREMEFDLRSAASGRIFYEPEVTVDVLKTEG